MIDQPQYSRIAQILAERIDHGDYHLTPMPSGRKLAEEMAVSHIVVRKAMEKLIADGRLRRLANGRLEVLPFGMERQRQPLSIAMLNPAFDCSYFIRCSQMLERVIADEGYLFRKVNYVHWNDPAIREALSGFDGVFLLGSTEPLTQATINLLRRGPARVATLDLDLTSAKIPRLVLFDASCVCLLLEHLAALGHRRIDYINTQPCDVETLRRIDAWSAWCRQNRIQGELHNRPVEHYGDPIQAARELTLQLQRSGKLSATALFCTNEAIAYGVLRALRDCGVRVGEEISVCTIGDGGNARYFCPSITSVEFPDISDLVRRVLVWMAGREAKWSGDLQLTVAELPFFHGESTAPAAAEYGRVPVECGMGGIR